MPAFDFEFTVDAPLDRVREFHHDTRALKRLTPPPTIVQLHEVEPLADGSVSRFTLWLGPLPLHWTAVHSKVSATGFTDTQSMGPMQRWEHIHSFVALSDRRTKIHEHIEYEHKRGIRGLMTRILFTHLNLFLMFTYRKLATRWFLAASRA